MKLFTFVLLCIGGARAFCPSRHSRTSTTLLSSGSPLPELDVAKAKAFIKKSESPLVDRVSAARTRAATHSENCFILFGEATSMRGV